jgi:hypothetical protein
MLKQTGTVPKGVSKLVKKGVASKRVLLRKP